MSLSFPCHACPASVEHSIWRHEFHRAQLVRDVLAVENVNDKDANENIWLARSKIDHGVGCGIYFSNDQSYHRSQRSYELHEINVFRF